jgi:hypothetical protein
MLKILRSIWPVMTESLYVIGKGTRAPKRCIWAFGNPTPFLIVSRASCPRHGDAFDTKSEMGTQFAGLTDRIDIVLPLCVLPMWAWLSLTGGHLTVLKGMQLLLGFSCAAVPRTPYGEPRGRLFYAIFSMPDTRCRIPVENL